MAVLPHRRWSHWASSGRRRWRCGCAWPICSNFAAGPSLVRSGLPPSPSLRRPCSLSAHSPGHFSLGTPLFSFFFFSETAQPHTTHKPPWQETKWVFFLPLP